VKNSRRLGRVLAVQSLYPQRINLKGPSMNLKNLIQGGNYGKEAVDFAKILVELVQKHLPEVDSLIESVLENWEWERLCALDKAILGIAVTEFLYLPEIPPKVVINEAIEIAKEYSTEKSGKFVNGILDSIAKKKGIL